MERDTSHIDDPDWNANDREAPEAFGEDDIENPGNPEDVYDEEDTGE
jgi:hypothetical protein